MQHSPLPAPVVAIVFPLLTFVFADCFPQTAGNALSLIDSFHDLKEKEIGLLFAGLLGVVLGEIEGKFLQSAYLLLNFFRNLFLQNFRAIHFLWASLSSED